MQMKTIRELSLFGFALLAGFVPVRAQPLRLDLGLDSLAARIGQGLGENGRKRIAVVEFTDLYGEVDELGLFAAEELVTRLVESDRFDVIDRRVLERVLVDVDEELTIAGMLDPEARQELRKALKLDCLVTGVIVRLEGMVKLNARVIAVESGIITSVATVDVMTDSEFEGLSGASRGKPGPAVSSVWLEGENLKVTSKTGGVFELQYTSGWGSNWSKNAHGWWHEGRLGDRLTLVLPMAQSGKYRLTAQFTKASDYGNVQLYLDGRKLGQPFFGYDPRVVPSGVIDLGTARLKAGDHDLVVEFTGEAKEVRHDQHPLGFALDYLDLTRIE